MRATEQACASLAPVYDGSAHFARANVAALRGESTIATESLDTAEAAVDTAVASATRGRSRPGRGP